jgi:hypothetical protein
MHHPEFKELCSEFERRIRAAGKNAASVKEFAEHCKCVNAQSVKQQLLKNNASPAL